MQKKSAEFLILLLMLSVVVLFALNSNRYFVRLDFTTNKAFTISKVSKELFQEIPDQVYITYYLSERLQSLYNFPAQIEDLLQEYAAHSRGKIIVSVLDPSKTGDAGKAESLGVYPQQIEVIEKDEHSVAKVYTGIVIQYLDRFETLPVVGRIDTLEYNLTSRIRKVVNNEKRVIGVLTGNTDSSIQQNFQALHAELSRDFSVTEVNRGEDIPDEISILFVLGNKDLAEFDLFPIDQYVMRGGRALFAVEGVNIDFRRNLEAVKMEYSPLLDMLESYGVRVQRALVLDEYCQNFRQPRVVFGQVMWQLMDKYPHWVTVADQFVSRDNPITARFGGLDLYWSSPLELIEKGGITAEAIIKTTPDAWLMEDHFETLPDRSAALFFMDKESRKQYTLAAVLTGSFNTFFSVIPERDGELREWQEIKKSSPENRILVVGDHDFASDFYQYTDAAYNMGFLSNCAEWLANDDDLLEIKTRVTRDIRLNKIQDPEKKGRAILMAQAINVVLVPIIVVAFGLFRFFKRRKKSLTTWLEG